MMVRQQNNDSGGKIKRRVIGAVVLVALLVIIVPALLDFRQDYDTVIVNSNIPPKPGNFRVEVLQFDEPREIPAVQSRAVLEASSQDASKSKTSQKTLDGVSGKDSMLSIEQDTAQAVAQRLDEMQKQGSRADAADSGADKGVAGWVVQLASLSRKQNAHILRDRARAQGFAAFVLQGEVKGQARYRVLVGPELLRSRAITVRDQLSKKINLKGIVVRYP